MKKGFTGILAFAIGVVLGFVAADKIMKQKYEQIVQDEIDSIKVAFRRKPRVLDKGKINKPDDNNEDSKPTETERQRYSKYVSGLCYAKEERSTPLLKPRVLSPDEFGCLDEYEQISLTCYSDGTVADDDDRAMSKDEIEETIGLDSLNHFGEYEDDSVFVRNDRLKVDYEILYDSRTYSEILEEKPYLKH